MSLWIALFRGINVGGRNILPMKDLRHHLESIKFKNVRSYIQSGNVVFESSSRSKTSLEKKIADCVEENHGFRPEIQVLCKSRLIESIVENPFPQATGEPKTLHFFFLSKPAKQANLEKLDSFRAATEKWVLSESIFYLWAPEGIGRSKLAANAERHLGVTTTARNYRTVEKIVEMLDE